jgi:hypothetical protein
MAYVKTEKGRKRVLWSEDETREAKAGFITGALNEYNLMKHFIKVLKKVRGEK